VKWDCNRHISDAFSPSLDSQGEFFHRYIIGLYEVLDRIFTPRPHILFESCASGGNRFDLGMLCFSPQIWTSDDTDPVERLKIQQGLSYLYPPSTMGAHVSDAPHQQTLRLTPLATRYNVACFGCLGYEMDLRYLNKVQRREIARQIAFYKEHRMTLQYGRFFRADAGRGRQVVWHAVQRDGSGAVTGFFQRLCTASPGSDRVSVPGLERGARYHIATVPQCLFLPQFGGLVKHLLPFSINPDGLLFAGASRLYSMENCVESHEVSGSVLAAGIELNSQFMGSGYNANVRMMGDYGSFLYLTEKTSSE
jgi:alpha-galactosidase